MAWLSNWLYRKTITIPASSIDEDMTYFPLTVYLDKSNFIFSNAEIDGKDIRFTSTDSNNTPLKFERKEHDGSMGDDNYYMSFNGSTDAINLGTETTLYYGETGKKLEFNFRINCENITNDSEPNYILARNSTTAGGANFEIGLHVGGSTEGGKIVSLVGKVEGDIQTPELATPGFHDLKVLFEDTTMSVYVDGTYKGAIESLQANNKFTSQPLRIGACSYTGGATLYGEGQFKISYFSALQEDVLKIELGFDEGSGTSVGSSTSTNDGTTVGDPTWTAINSVGVYNVLVPAISGSTDTSIYMWYGNQSAYNASTEAWQDQTGKQLTYVGDAVIVRNSATDHYAKFTRSGAGYFTLLDSDDWYFNTSDFCIETRVYRTQASALTYYLLASGTATGASSHAWYLGFTSGKELTASLSNGSNNTTITTSGGNYTTGNWYDVAFLKTGGYLYLYVNGIQVAQQQTTYAGANASSPLYIGALGAGEQFDGYMSGVRITKGRARYADSTNYIDVQTGTVGNIPMAGAVKPITNIVAVSGGFTGDLGTETTAGNISLDTPFVLSSASSPYPNYYIKTGTASPNIIASVHSSVKSYTPPTSFEIDGTDVVLCSNFDSVYDSNYKMVQHMGDILLDASGTGNKATIVGSVPTIMTSLGTQRDFSGTTGNYMTVAQSTTLDMSSFTIQSLVNFDTLSSAYHYLFSRNNGTNAEGYYALSTNYDGTVGRTEIIISSSYRTADTNATLSTGTNLVLTGVYEQGVSLRTHINGIQDGTPYTGNYTLGTLSSTAYIGAQGDANWTDGKIGELRLSNITRSTSWIKAEALALKNNLITMSVANIKSQTLTAVQHTTHIDLSWT